MPRAQIDAGSASTPRRPSERGIAISCVGVFRHDLACESVQARDPPLAVVARETGVGRPLLAGAAAGARSADHGRDEVAACESMSVTLDEAEQLVPEDERRVVLRRHAEQSLGDLPVGPADTDLEHSNRYLARERTHIRYFGDSRRARPSWLRDERQHGQGGPCRVTWSAGGGRHLPRPTRRARGSARRRRRCTERAAVARRPGVLRSPIRRARQ